MVALTFIIFLLFNETIKRKSVLQPLIFHVLEQSIIQKVKIFQKNPSSFDDQLVIENV